MGPDLPDPSVIGASRDR